MPSNKSAKAEHDLEEAVRMTDRWDINTHTHSEMGGEGSPTDSEFSSDFMSRLQRVHIDDIWRRLGVTGKFQLQQTLSSFTCIFSISWHILSMIFIGYEPDHQCSRPFNESFRNDMQVSEYTNTSTEYSSCQITTFYNDTVGYRTGCIYGYNYSVPWERSYVSEWNLVCQTGFLSGLPQSVLIIGQGVGAAVGQIADKVGRRPIFVYSQVLLFCVTFGTAFAREYWTLLLLRFLTGLLQQILGLSSWIILIEVFTNEHRPLLTLVGGLMWSFCLGLLTPVAYVMRNGSWRTLQMVMSAPALSFVIPLFLTTESLRWLIVTGRLKEALKLLKTACRQNNVSLEYVLQTEDTHNAKELLPMDKKENSVEMIPGIASNKTKLVIDLEDGLVGHDKEDNSAIIAFNKDVSPEKKESVHKLFTDKRIRCQTFIVCFAWFVNVLVFFGLYLTPTFNFGGRYLTFFLNTSIELPVCVIVWFCLSRIGRKTCSIVAHGFAGICLLLFTILPSISNITETAPGLLTCLLVLGKMSIMASFTLLFAYTPELYPTNLRNAGLGMASFCGRLAGIIVPYSIEMAKIRSWIPGITFAVLCLLVTVLMINLPETMGRELPQTIDDMSYKNKSAKKTKHGNEKLFN